MLNIDEKIKELEQIIADPELCKGTATTWTRITGYYRFIQNFNPGKAQEYIERLEYLIPD